MEVASPPIPPPLPTIEPKNRCVIKGAVSPSGQSAMWAALDYSGRIRTRSSAGSLLNTFTIKISAGLICTSFMTYLPHRVNPLIWTFFPLKVNYSPIT